jgi:hypothetical protein
MPSSEQQPDSEATCLDAPMRNLCPSGHLTRGFWLHGGDSTLVSIKPKSFASGTTRLHASMAGLIG